ncbi:MAG: hypothetical protein Q4F88_04570, partial [Eubacteriales bacterium]|nr:hypothetical protein [Eubacteriales bacterium]
MNSTVLSKGDAIEVEMNMDYRYFFMSNQLYYDELSNMSLLYANSIYMKDSGIKIEDANNQENKNLRIKELMQFYGFKDVKTYYMGSEKNDGYEEGDLCRNYPDTHKGRIAIGHKEIEYHGLKKTIVGIVTRGTAEDDDWDNDFDIGDLKLREGIVQVAKPGYENYSVDNEEEKSSNNTQENEKEKSSKNTLAIDGYLKSDNNNNKYDHKYNTELAHFAYGYPDWTNEYHHAGFDIVANR